MGRAGRYELALQFALPGMIPLHEWRALLPPPSRIDGLGDAPMPAKAAADGVDGEVDVAVTIDAEGIATKAIFARVVPMTYPFSRATISALKTWRFQPGAAGTYRLSLSFALEREVEGEAPIALVVGPGGMVSETRVVSESPEGYGFGAAAAEAVSHWEYLEMPVGPQTVTIAFKLP